MMPSHWYQTESPLGKVNEQTGIKHLRLTKENANMSDLQEGESIRLWMVQYPGGRICGGVFHVTRGRGGSKSMLLSMENPLSKDFVPKAESQQSRPCHWAGISHLNGQGVAMDGRSQN